jgi:hypothetical protein
MRDVSALRRHDPETIERLRFAFLGERRPIDDKVIAAVRAELEGDPDATGSAINRRLRERDGKGFRKQAVMDAVRALRVAGEPVPTPSERHPEGGESPPDVDEESS